MVPLYDDSNYHSLLPNGEGIVEFNGPRLCLAVPPRLAIGEVPHAEPFPERLIPRSEWPDLIRKKDAEKSWLEDIMRGVVPCKDQGSLGYCHAFGCAHAGEVQRLVQNLLYVELSGESLGGPITNWRNRGADPADDLSQLVQCGACPQVYVDQPLSLNPKRWKSGWETAALEYRATEVWDMRSDTKAFDFAATLAFLNVPGGSGFQWWSHFVSGPYRVLDLGRGKFALRYRNNWGADYGDDGFMDFAEGKGTPDWCYGLRQMYWNAV
jgi:hypothetical protein